MWTAAAAYTALNARGARIKWKPSRARDLAGYKVLVSRNEEGPYTELTEELVTSTEFNTPQLRYGDYYFIVISIDKRGNKSLRSLPARVGIT